MELVPVVLAMIVVLVAIDAIGRLDERRAKTETETATAITSSEKIVVDMTDRDRD